MQKSKQKLLSQQLSRAPPPQEVNVNSLVLGGGGGAVSQPRAFYRCHLLKGFAKAPAFVFYAGREGVPCVGTLWPSL